MSNPLKKTMVYLGLADDDLAYAEQQQQNATQQSEAAPAAAVSEAPAVAAPAAAQASAPAAPVRAAVTPLRRPAVTHQSAPTELSEILTVHPKQYKDAQIIAETFRDGVPVIINLSEMSDGDARRLIDFSSGLSQGLGGKIERVTNKVFLLSPAHVAVLGDTAADDAGADSAFFAQQ